MAVLSALVSMCSPVAYSSAAVRRRRRKRGPRSFGRIWGKWLSSLSLRLGCVGSISRGCVCVKCVNVKRPRLVKRSRSREGA